jgi:hypothetical protein
MDRGIDEQSQERMASSGMLRRVALVRTDVSDNISPPSSGFLRVIGPSTLSNSDSTVTQLLGPVTLRNADDEGHILFETSALTTAIQYEVPEGNS